MTPGLNFYVRDIIEKFKKYCEANIRLSFSGYCPWDIWFLQKITVLEQCVVHFE